MAWERTSPVCTGTACHVTRHIAVSPRDFSLCASRSDSASTRLPMAFSAEQALTLLRKAQVNDRLAHAYLITGPVGSGTREVAAGLTGILVNESENPLKHPDVHI